VSGTDLPLTASSSRALSSPLRLAKPLPKRLQALDAFRGFSLMVMIFVNYGGLIEFDKFSFFLKLFFTGGGYWFFKHSSKYIILMIVYNFYACVVWNGLTVADLVFPWFTWMMGVSIVLSQRSLRAKNVRKITIFFKILRRTLILFMLGMCQENQLLFLYCRILGLILQGGWNRFIFIRIFGVLQRLAMCYFFAAILVLIFDDKEDEPYKVQWPTSIELKLKE
jgi:heparan-alpha-glucosaminide N-acetyltransferase